MGTKADSRRAHPHRLVAPKLKKPADAMRSSGFAATAPAAAYGGAPGAPSAIPRISTTDIIARARKQVQNPHDGVLGRRATTGGLRPIGENADLQRKRIAECTSLRFYPASFSCYCNCHG